MPSECEGDDGRAAEFFEHQEANKRNYANLRRVRDCLVAGLLQPENLLHPAINNAFEQFYSALESGSSEIPELIAQVCDLCIHTLLLRYTRIPEFLSTKTPAIRNAWVECSVLSLDIERRLLLLCQKPNASALPIVSNLFQGLLPFIRDLLSLISIRSDIEEEGPRWRIQYGVCRLLCVLVSEPEIGQPLVQKFGPQLVVSLTALIGSRAEVSLRIEASRLLSLASQYHIISGVLSGDAFGRCLPSFYTAISSGNEELREAASLALWALYRSQQLTDPAPLLSDSSSSVVPALISAWEDACTDSIAPLDGEEGDSFLCLSPQRSIEDSIAPTEPSAIVQTPVCPSESDQQVTFMTPATPLPDITEYQSPFSMDCACDSVQIASPDTFHSPLEDDSELKAAVAEDMEDAGSDVPIGGEEELSSDTLCCAPSRPLMCRDERLWVTPGLAAASSVFVAAGSEILTNALVSSSLPLTILAESITGHFKQLNSAGCGMIDVQYARLETCAYLACLSAILVAYPPSHLALKDGDEVLPLAQRLPAELICEAIGPLCAASLPSSLTNSSALYSCILLRLCSLILCELQIRSESRLTTANLRVLCLGLGLFSPSEVRSVAARRHLAWQHSDKWLTACCSGEMAPYMDGMPPDIDTVALSQTVLPDLTADRQQLAAAALQWSTSGIPASVHVPLHETAESREIRERTLSLTRAAGLGSSVLSRSQNSIGVHLRSSLGSVESRPAPLEVPVSAFLLAGLSALQYLVAQEKSEIIERTEPNSAHMQRKNQKQTERRPWIPPSHPESDSIRDFTRIEVKGVTRASSATRSKLACTNASILIGSVENKSLLSLCNEYQGAIRSLILESPSAPAVHGPAPNGCDIFQDSVIDNTDIGGFPSLGTVLVMRATKGEAAGDQLQTLVRIRPPTASAQRTTARVVLASAPHKIVSPKRKRVAYQTSAQLLEESTRLKMSTNEESMTSAAPSEPLEPTDSVMEQPTESMVPTQSLEEEESQFCPPSRSPSPPSPLRSQEPQEVSVEEIGSNYHSDRTEAANQTHVLRAQMGRDQRLLGLSLGSVSLTGRSTLSAVDMMDEVSREEYLRHQRVIQREALIRHNQRMSQGRVQRAAPDPYQLSDRANAGTMRASVASPDPVLTVDDLRQSITERNLSSPSYRIPDAQDVSLARLRVMGSVFVYGKRTELAHLVQEARDACVQARTAAARCSVTDSRSQQLQAIIRLNRSIFLALQSLASAVLHPSTRSAERAQVTVARLLLSSMAGERGRAIAASAAAQQAPAVELKQKAAEMEVEGIGLLALSRLLREALAQA